MNDIRVIDLGEFGQTGTVEVSMPSLSRRIARDNAIGNCNDVKMVNGEPVLVGTRAGDAAVIKILAFVRKAPFPTDLTGFLRYCDRMDDNELGSAERMLEAIERAALEVQGVESPLANSQVAETQSSD